MRNTSNRIVLAALNAVVAFGARHRRLMCPTRYRRTGYARSHC